MPSFRTDAEVEVDILEFMDACSSREIKEVIEFLIENDHIDSISGVNNKQSLNELGFNDNLRYLSQNYHSLTLEEEEVIRKMVKRFVY